MSDDACLLNLLQHMFLLLLWAQAKPTEAGYCCIVASSFTCTRLACLEIQGQNNNGTCCPYCEGLGCGRWASPLTDFSWWSKGVALSLCSRSENHSWVTVYIVIVCQRFTYMYCYCLVYQYVPYMCAWKSMTARGLTLADSNWLQTASCICTRVSL